MDNKELLRVEESRRSLLRALWRIVNEEGMVCPEYEICKHPACRSSHAAWEIAEEAVNKDAQRF